MSAKFLEIASELRNDIYEKVLIHGEPIDPSNIFARQQLNTGLLRVNKSIHREASSLFYSQNSFDFTIRDSLEVTLFLRQIGRINASQIRNIHTDFPSFFSLEPGHVSLSEDSIALLESLEESCTNLKTLTASLYSTDAMEEDLGALEDPNVVTEALQMVDSRFRAIPSLREIIVEVYSKGPSSRVRKEIEEREWTIKMTPNVEQESFAEEAFRCSVPRMDSSDDSDYFADHDHVLFWDSDFDFDSDDDL